MSYTVHIRKNATGEVRECFIDLEWEEGSEYWWSEGNMSCDCNRALEFARAKGEPDPDYRCTQTDYNIVNITGDVWERDLPYVIDKD